MSEKRPLSEKIVPFPQKRPLGEKRPNPLYETICRKLIDLGYRPGFFLNGKDHPPKGWPTAELRRTASGRTLAIRMQDNKDLACLDVDITHEALAAAALKLTYAKFPSLCQSPHRHSGQAKVMLFVRCRTDGQRLKSRVWLRAEDVGVEGAETHKIEFFTSNDARYVASHGMHSEGREYGWRGVALEDVAFADLVEVDYADVAALLDRFDELAEREGFVQKAEKRHGAKAPIYDLRPEHEIVLQDGRRMTLGELAEIAPEHGSWIRCFATPWEPASETDDRVKANIGPYGLELWDCREEEMHYWETEKPADLGELTAMLLKLKEDCGGGDDGGGGFFGTAPLPEGVTIGDFRAHMPSHKFIYMPTGDLWPGASLNSRLPVVRLVRPDGTVVPLKPTTWLDNFRPVEQMLWAPGLPQIVEGRLLTEGGWSQRGGVAAYNTYQPPERRKGGVAARAVRWLDLIEKIYPDHVEHIVEFLAFCVQHPEVKINHGLVLVGAPGIGKDTILKPVVAGVGPWNFKEVSPREVAEKWNDFMRGVVVRISEARDLGDIDRYEFYEKTKVMLAAPPDVLRIAVKFVPHYYILNVCKVIITTNHAHDGLFLPPNDRRHYVAGTEITQEKVGDEKYWNELNAWYDAGGIDDVRAYLEAYDLSAFDPKAPPKKTEAFWALVGAAVAPEVSELEDALANLGNPVVVTMRDMYGDAGKDLKSWLDDRANRRTMPHRMESCGYIIVRNPGAKSGLWVIGGRRQAIYGRLDVTPAERLAAASKLTSARGPTVEESVRRLKDEGDGKKGK